MWRRIYLFLVLVRLYGALCLSYIHPDEQFQGPEVIASEIFGFPAHKTWEFTSSRPVRSIFPLWVVYGAPLTLLKWIWEGLGYGPVAPFTAFYGLRIVMFLLSFVLGDWAIHELLSRSNSDRRVAIILVSSSFVTATFQTHTFSNSIETLIVLWTLVLAARLRDVPGRLASRACLVLAFLLVLGVFTRITFPAFVVLPLLQLIPGLLAQPLRIPILAFAGIFTLLVAVAMDTEYYTGEPLRLRQFSTTAVLTPINNLLYNLDESNLAQHGIHPFWQHFVANLPQLLGPFLPLLVVSSQKNTLFWSGVIGIALLSLFRHQEPRFLLPAVPLLLSSIRLPRSNTRVWIAVWATFNVLAFTLFGMYHQGGVVPAQIWLSNQDPSTLAHVTWWKTYSPPRWLLGTNNVHVETTDLMGADVQNKLIPHLSTHALCPGEEGLGALLVAPLNIAQKFKSSHDREQTHDLHFREVWRHRRHVGLDDLDWGDDGVWGTLSRLIGQRGLAIYRVEKPC